MANDPDRILIIDDTERGKYIADALTNRDWLTKLDKKLASEIALTETSIKFIQIGDARTFGAAEEAIRQPGSMLLFLDMKLDERTSSRDIKNKIADCLRSPEFEESEFSTLKSSELGLGGLFLAHCFAPKVPDRLLCITSKYYMEGLREIIVDGSIVPGQYPQKGDHIEQSRKAVFAALRHWVKFHSSLLERVWSLSADWFSEADDSVMPHTAKTLHPTEYAENIRSAFGFGLPIAWFNTPRSPSGLWESLKSMCGVRYDGSPDVKMRKYNVNLGGAFVIALLALKEEDRLPDLNRIDLNQLCLRNGFFHRQAKGPTNGPAKDTARAFYELLRLFFRWEAKHQGLGTVTAVDIQIVDAGNGIRFCLPGCKHRDVENALKKKEGASPLAKSIQKFTGLFAIGDGVVVGSHGRIVIEDAALTIFGDSAQRATVAVCSQDRAACAVFCRDLQRAQRWTDILLQAGLPCVYVIDKQDGAVRNEAEKPPNPDSALPMEFDFLIVHQGDRDLLDAMSVRSQKEFWFDSPGNPAPRDGGVGIYRSTAVPHFDLTVDDAKEIIAYGKGERASLPRCCVRPKNKEIVAALCILCQGYLAVHSTESDGKPSLPATDPDYGSVNDALVAMGWQRFIESHGGGTPGGTDFKKRRKELAKRSSEYWDVFGKEDVSRALDEEWEGTKEGREDVQPFLNWLRNRRSKEPLGPAVVARAYMALREELERAEK